MTKSLILATAMALSLGAAAAMAQEGDAQNLFSGSPSVFNEFSRGDFGIRTGSPLSDVHRAAYSVQSRPLSIVPDGSDGGGN